MLICKPCAERTGQTWRKHKSNSTFQLCTKRYRDVMLVEDKPAFDSTDVGEQLSLEID